MKKNLYSNWREDLREVMDDPSAESKTDTSSERSVKDKKVNNKVIINPSMREAFEEIGGVILSLHETDMSTAPNIKDAKPSKKSNVKYDPHMKVMAPTIKSEERLTKQDLEKMQDDKDKKEARTPDNKPEVKEDLGNLQLKRAKEERKIAMIDMRIANERKKVESSKNKSNTSDTDQQSQQVKEVLDTNNDDVIEATEDSLRDRRMERGGVDGNNRYKKPVSNTPNTFGKKKPVVGGPSALDVVKAQIRAKHGKGAIIDSKKK